MSEAVLVADMLKCFREKGTLSTLAKRDSRNYPEPASEAYVIMILV